MAGNFDNEIKQAMAPNSKGKVPPPGVKQSAKSFPPKPPAQSTPPPSAPPMMQGGGGIDPVTHAAGIAHAILAHGGR